jgi:hypothetical protein
VLEDRSHYMAFLLRLWRAGSEDVPVWRASLESPRTGEYQVFANLDALFAFLRDCSTSGHGQDDRGSHPPEDWPAQSPFPASSPGDNTEHTP